LEEFDYSHNQISGEDYIIENLTLKTLNSSFNKITNLTLNNNPNLVYLDASNNLLTWLDLRDSGSLIELNCSNNPLTNLTLTHSPNLKSFDCLGAKFDKSNSLAPTTTITSTCPTSSTLLTQTIYLNNPALTMGLGIPLGISLLG